MRIIETERLYLRELHINDKKDLMRVLSDSESMKHTLDPFSEEKVEKWIEWNIENYKKYNHGLWAVMLKEDETFIGDCGITMQCIENETVPEIGYHIIRQYCNKGYATEAALACKKYALEVLGYTEVFSYCKVQNIPSQKVAAKIGMRFYKYFELLGEKEIVHVASREQS